MCFAGKVPKLSDKKLQNFQDVLNTMYKGTHQEKSVKKTVWEFNLFF